MHSDVDTLVSIMSQIWRVVRQSKDALPQQPVSLFQMHTLHYLERSPETKMSDLAKHLGMSLSSATQLIERLVKSGFIHRLNDQNDRRIIRLLITGAGKAELKRLHQIKKEKLKEIFANIPPQDIKELIRIQGNLLETLKK